MNPLTNNNLKLISIISSCQNLEQLKQASMWIDSVVDRKNDSERNTHEALGMVICCKYYDLARDKKTLPWNLKVEIPAPKVSLHY